MADDNKLEHKRIFVGGITWATTDEDLKRDFDKFGPVTEAHVSRHKDFPHRSRGFGFVTFENADDCAKAKEEMDSKEHNGRVLKIDFARDRPDRPDRPNRTDDETSERIPYHERMKEREVYEARDVRSNRVERPSQDRYRSRDDRRDPPRDDYRDPMDGRRGYDRYPPNTRDSYRDDTHAYDQPIVRTQPLYARRDGRDDRGYYESKPPTDRRYGGGYSSNRSEVPLDSYRGRDDRYSDQGRTVSVGPQSYSREDDRSYVGMSARDDRTSYSSSRGYSDLGPRDVGTSRAERAPIDHGARDDRGAAYGSRVSSRSDPYDSRAASGYSVRDDRGYTSRGERGGRSGYRDEDYGAYRGVQDRRANDSSRDSMRAPIPRESPRGHYRESAMDDRNRRAPPSRR